MLQVRSTLILLSACALAACQGEAPPAEESAVTAAEIAPAPMPEPAVPAAPVPVTHTLVALPGMEESVPVITQKRVVQMQTDAGPLTIEIYPEAAPHAAERFLELVSNGFYNETPISRVVPGFVAQFGINWREPYQQWQNNNFADDPTLFALERGTLAFAKAGIDTNSTQVFINYAENNRLAAPQYNFTVFGKVVEGMDIVDKFVQVGDPSGGLDQGLLWDDGGTYLQSLELKPTMILSASVVE